MSAWISSLFVSVWISSPFLSMWIGNPFVSVWIKIPFFNPTIKCSTMLSIYITYATFVQGTISRKIRCVKAFQSCHWTPFVCVTSKHHLENCMENNKHIKRKYKISLWSWRTMSQEKLILGVRCEQVIRVKKLVGLPPHALKLLGRLS